jgi:hypothetical protein
MTGLTKPKTFRAIGLGLDLQFKDIKPQMVRLGSLLCNNSLTFNAEADKLAQIDAEITATKKILVRS